MDASRTAVFRADGAGGGLGPKATPKGARRTPFPAGVVGPSDNAWVVEWTCALHSSTIARIALA